MKEIHTPVFEKQGVSKFAVRCSTLIAFLVLGANANASLQGRDLDGNLSNGFEAYYDTALNITWLSNANLYRDQFAAATDKLLFIESVIASAPVILGHTITGNLAGGDVSTSLNWWGAMSWTQGLNIYGYDDWRLPGLTPINGLTFNTVSAYDGSSDTGYNITSLTSELSYMYHVNLGLRSFYDPLTGISQSGWGAPASGLVEIPGQPGEFINGFTLGTYWYGVESTPDKAWNFDNLFGSQNGDISSSKDFRFSAWAVRDGDVNQSIGTVPEPGTLSLGAIALFAVGACSQRRHVRQGALETHPKTPG